MQTSTRYSYSAEPKDHTGCKRGFIWTSQAYYCKSALAARDVIDNIMIGMYHPEGGTTGEFSIEWTKLGGRDCAQLKAYDDSWSALQLFADVLVKLAEHDDASITPAQVADLLLACGVVDLTKRVDSEVSDVHVNHERVDNFLAGLKLLNDDERMSVFSNFCRHCGSTDPKCTCMRDD